MTAVETVATVAGRPHVVLLTAGDWCYVYSGYNRRVVLGHAQAAEVVMIGANLDTDVRFIDPARIADLLPKLIEAAGPGNVELMPYHEQRRCLVCGTDLTDVMGVYVFVEDKAATDGALMCVKHGERYGNHVTDETYLRLREIDEARPYPAAGDDEPEPMTRARQFGHDPVFDGVRGARWTCRRCHRAVLEEGAQVYGSAIEAACIRAGSLQWRA